MDKYQDQLSSGKRINRPSDDPIGAVQGMFYRASLMETRRYLQNAEEGLSWMEITDHAMEDVTNVIHRVRELTVQASNGTYSQDQYNAIIAEIQQLSDHLGQVANTTIAGQYIFGGNDTVNEPFPHFGGSRADIVVVPGSEQPIAAAVADGSAPSWAGEKIVFSATVSGQPNIYLNDSGTPVIENGQYPALSKDGRMIAFIRDNELVVADDQGNVLKQVGPAGNHPPVWSPDGKYLYYLDQTGTKINKVEWANPANEETIEFPGITDLEIQSFSVSPDQSRIVIQDKDDKLYLADKDGANASTLTDGTNPLSCRDPVFSPDGSKIAFSDGKDILLLKLATNEVINLTQGLPSDIVQRTQITWSSDGKKIAFRGENGTEGRIYTLEMADVTRKPTETGRGNYIDVNVFGRDVFKHRKGIFGVMDGIISDLKQGKNVSSYLADLEEQLSNVLKERSSLGARMKRMELTVTRLTRMEDTTQRLLSYAEDADIAKVITDLKAQENVHRAALAAGARIIQPSLVDFLR